MDVQAFKELLERHLAEAIPEGHDPWPTIRDRLMQRYRIGAHLERKTTSTSRQGARIAAIASGLSLLVLMLLLSTPSGKALAQSVVSFFRTTDQRSYPVPDEFAAVGSQVVEPSTPVPTSIAVISGSPGQMTCDQDVGGAMLICELQRLEVELGFPVRVLPLQDAELVVDGLVADPASHSLAISYTNPYSLEVTLRQGLGDFPPDSTYDRVPPEAVRSVSVGAFPGEIVRGMFVQFVDGDRLEWWASAPMLRLRWMEGGRWYEIERFGSPEFSAALDEDDLVSLGELLKHVASPTDAMQAVGFPTTLEAAEFQAGIDIKIPAAIPSGFDFRYAQVSAETGRVMLVYSTDSGSGPRGFLVVNEAPEGAHARWIGSARVMDVSLGATVARYVAGYNRGAESPFKPAELLAWSADGLDFEMLHFSTAEDGYNTRLGPEGMIAIAEGLH